jgi:hypothetical protein
MIGRSVSLLDKLREMERTREAYWLRHPGNRPRVVYLADAGEARRRLETDAVELGVTGMARVAPLRVEAYRSFLASHPRFAVYGREGAWDWLSSALRDARADTTVVARNPEDGTPLLDVRRGGTAP